MVRPYAVRQFGSSAACDHRPRGRRGRSAVRPQRQRGIAVEQWHQIARQRAGRDASPSPVEPVRPESCVDPGKRWLPWYNTGPKMSDLPAWGDRELPLSLLNMLRVWRWRRQYRVGSVVTQFVAKDIRRDVEVIDCSELDSGLILGRVRTWNVLHARHGIKAKPSFGEARRLHICDLWHWPGPDWGGPVPDSESDSVDA